MANRIFNIWLLCFGIVAASIPGSALAQRVLHEERSLYSQIIVREYGGQRCLLFSVRRNQRNQTCVDLRRPKQMQFSYTRMAMSSLLFTPQPQSILVVGLGGGTLPMAFAELYPDAHIDAVEIDPAVVRVAKDYFEFRPGPNVKVHTQDARVWTKRALRQTRRYDIVILDAFNGEYIPEHLMTREYLLETQSLLTARGTLMANTFAISDLYHNESATYANVFGEFLNFRVPESSNRMIVVPSVLPDKDTLKQRARDIADTLKPYKVPITRYAKVLASAATKKPDWDEDARVLTDQYAPANLLQEGAR